MLPFKECRGGNAPTLVQLTLINSLFFLVMKTKQGQPQLWKQQPSLWPVLTKIKKNNLVMEEAKGE